MNAQLDYGNWIRRKNLLILGLLTAIAGALTLLPFGPIYLVVMASLFVLMCLCLFFPLYAYIVFSQKGGRFQEKLYDLIVEQLNAKPNGVILDIGAGDGILALKCAQKYPEAALLGIDTWGKDWEYSKGVCEKNARLAGVENRVHFQKGDAAALGFSANAFDAAISNLTFHEVRSAPDKKDVLCEALRVIKPAGSFAFIDYFFDAQYYGKISELEQYLAALHLTQFVCKPLAQMLPIPALLRHPRALGRVGIIYGRK